MTSAGERPSALGREKDAAAFRTIREVADEVGVAQHVLRFWETRFPELRPLKRGGNRRYYRPADVALVRALARLLHGEGYTIRGVQQLIASHGAKHLVTLVQEGAAPAPADVPVIPAAANPPAGNLVAELREIRALLATALSRAA